MIRVLPPMGMHFIVSPIQMCIVASTSRTINMAVILCAGLWGYKLFSAPTFQSLIDFYFTREGASKLRKKMADIQGYCEAQFGKVRKMLKTRVNSGDELGVSFAVKFNGETKVDHWGGFEDKERTQAWARDTVVPVWSTTKTITSLAMLLLIDRGLIKPSDKICHYWPEFAANGKELIDVRHVLGHTSGLSGIQEAVTWNDAYDFDKIIGLLANQAPWWEPGTKSGYHTMSWGYIMGEIVRRVIGRNLAQFIKDGIASPLDADFWLGLPQEHWGWAADIVPPKELPNGVAQSLDQ